MLNRLRGALWNVPTGWQLGGLYAVLFATSLFILGAALYTRLDSFLLQNTASRLIEASRPLTNRHFENRASPYTPPPLGNNTFLVFGQDQYGGFFVRGLSGPDVNVALTSSTGTVITATQTLDGDAIPLPELPTGWQSSVTLTNPPAQWVVPDPAGGRRLVLAIALQAPSEDDTGETVYLLQSASLAAADAVLNEVRFYLALGIVFGTLIGLLASLALARIVLRPLNRMGRAAEAVAAGDLSRRLHLPPGRNEVARLGHTFDYMVGRLSATFDAQRRFVADASHELRTPLTSLEGLSELLMMGADRGDPSTTQRTARAIHSELLRLGRLVSDLLTLSRLDSAAEFERAHLDANAILRGVAEQMGPMAAMREISIKTDTHSSLPITGDQDRLKQVLINLVDNAVRFTPPGGSIWLRGTLASDGGNVRLEVEDSGQGIAPADLPRIFERFYRGDRSRTRATGNTGLGLAIARAIVEAHGGSLEAVSPPGKGALFTILLPMASERETSNVSAERTPVHALSES